MKNIHKIKNNIYITSNEEIKPNVYALINKVLCKTELLEGRIVSRQLVGMHTLTDTTTGCGSQSFGTQETFEEVAERMYSDEEVLKLILKSGKLPFANDDERIQWFEQFIKK